MSHRARGVQGQAVAPGSTKLAMRSGYHSIGSNNWTVAGSRSADGHAIVANDMHLGIRLPHIWYRAVLQFPDAQGQVHRIVGVTLPGAPFVVVGSNGHVAWGFTNSYGDWVDLIALDTDPKRPGQVRLADGWQMPTPVEERIAVKGGAAQTLTTSMDLTVPGGLYTIAATRVVVPDHQRVRPGTLRQILNEAGVTVEQLLKLR